MYFSYQTIKFYVSSSTVVECIAIITKCSTAPIRHYVDYLRGSPANQTGWQHDGSTTAGVTITPGVFTYEEQIIDGDIYQVNITASASSWCDVKFIYDVTSTVAKPERTYYQFLKMKWRMVGFTGSYMTLRIDYDDYRYTGSGLESFYHTADFDWSIERINLASFTTGDVEPSNIRLFGYLHNGQTATVEVDYVKAYSIAKYTVTQSGTSTDDVLYVEDGVLICEGTSFTDITLDRDPALNMTYPYYGWGLNSSSGTPQVDFYNASGYWIGYSSETEGTFPYASTITDVRFKFTDSANIISLTFFDATGWRDSGLMDIMLRIKSWFVLITVIVGIIIAVFTGSLDAFLILIGLALIPVSVLYLVKGGRDEMSFDKVAIFSVVIFLGIGLFIGGIMP